MITTDGTTIDAALIERLVRAFYARVPAEPVIGPIFSARIQHWEPHIVEICAFWSSVMLGTRTYSGRPMQKHVRLPIDRMHFEAWLKLFELTAREICPGDAADHFIERARTIGRGLEMGVASFQGRL